MSGASGRVRWYDRKPTTLARACLRQFRLGLPQLLQKAVHQALKGLALVVRNAMGISCILGDVVVRLFGSC